MWLQNKGYKSHVYSIICIRGQSSFKLLVLVLHCIIRILYDLLTVEHIIWCVLFKSFICIIFLASSTLMQSSAHNPLHRILIIFSINDLHQFFVLLINIVANPFQILFSILKLVHAVQIDVQPELSYFTIQLKF